MSLVILSVRHYRDITNVEIVAFSIVTIHLHLNSYVPNRISLPAPLPCHSEFLSVCSCDTKTNEDSHMAESWATFCCPGSYR